MAKMIFSFLVPMKEALRRKDEDEMLLNVVDEMEQYLPYKDKSETELRHLAEDAKVRLQTAGSVLRPYTSVKVSMRIPPRLDAARATAALKAALEKDPPYGARVTFDGEKAGGGKPGK